MLLNSFPAFVKFVKFLQCQKMLFHIYSVNHHNWVEKHHKHQYPESICFSFVNNKCHKYLCSVHKQCHIVDTIQKPFSCTGIRLLIFTGGWKRLVCFLCLNYFPFFSCLKWKKKLLWIHACNCYLSKFGSYLWFAKLASWAAAQMNHRSTGENHLLFHLNLIIISETIKIPKQTIKWTNWLTDFISLSCWHSAPYSFICSLQQMYVCNWR